MPSRFRLAKTAGIIKPCQFIKKIWGKKAVVGDRYFKIVEIHQLLSGDNCGKACFQTEKSFRRKARVRSDMGSNIHVQALQQTAKGFCSLGPFAGKRLQRF